MAISKSEFKGDMMEPSKTTLRPCQEIVSPALTQSPFVNEPWNSLVTESAPENSKSFSPLQVSDEQVFASKASSLS